MFYEPRTATIFNYRLMRPCIASEAPIGSWDISRARRSATKRPMSSESADRELVSILVDGLLLCIPLFVFFVSSLGIIALKRISRLPRWAARLVAPPFYFIAHCHSDCRIGDCHMDLGGALSGLRTLPYRGIRLGGRHHTLELFSGAATTDTVGRRFVRVDVRQHMPFVADATARGRTGICFEKCAAAA
jgi:hypothetical protein